MPFAVVGLQNLPFPATCAGRLVTADFASLPDGTVGLEPLLILFGEGDTLVVGAVFCALAMVTPLNITAAAANVMRAFIVIAPYCKLRPLAGPIGI